MAADSRDDGHAHDHTAGANTRQLTIALGLTGTFLVAEIAGGLYFNSLALLSDAAHMFTDAAALGLALLAIHIGRRAADEYGPSPGCRTSRPTGTIIAPPIPCTKRAPTSIGSDADCAQASEPSRNTPIAAQNRLREPNRSASVPLAGMKRASASR